MSGAFQVGLLLRLVAGSLGLMPLAARHTAISPIRGGAQVASRCAPDRLGVALAGVILDLLGEVGDELGSLAR
jgi:hypothetical protein